jgi:predicted hydrocarbon binding protein
MGRKYEFSWDLIGMENIGDARPNLGPTMRMEVYRLMQFTLRDVLEERYGSDTADDLFRAAGRKAGKAFFGNLMQDVGDFGDMVQKLQGLLETMSVGILRIEEVDMENGRFVLTVGEDLDCSGLPDTGIDVCIYDEGFIAGILEAYTKKPFEVREVDCWCTGDRTCRFVAKAQ